MSQIGNVKIDDWLLGKDRRCGMLLLECLQEYLAQDVVHVTVLGSARLW